MEFQLLKLPVIVIIKYQTFCVIYVNRSKFKKMFWYYFICDKAKFEMSTSTVELQETFTSEEIGLQALDPKFLEPKPPVLLVASMWLFQSIFSACKMEFTGNLQGGSSIIHFSFSCFGYIVFAGISVSFNMQDVVLIAFTAWMLHKGLATVSRLNWRQL